MAKKDTYYFSHDANADSDPKIIKLLRKHGLAGYGCFWIIIQQLREQADFELAEDDIPDLAYAKHAEESLYRSVVYEFQLFEISNGRFYSNRLKRSMEEFNAIREARRKGADETNRKKAEKKQETERSASESDTLSERNEKKESKSTELTNQKQESKNVPTPSPFFLDLVKKCLYEKTDWHLTYCEKKCEKFARLLFTKLGILNDFDGYVDQILLWAADEKGDIPKKNDFLISDGRKIPTIGSPATHKDFFKSLNGEDIKLYWHVQKEILGWYQDGYINNGNTPNWKKKNETAEDLSAIRQEGDQSISLLKPLMFPDANISLKNTNHHE